MTSAGVVNAQPVAATWTGDGIATVALRDVAGKNALTPELVEALIETLRRLAAWDGLKVVVLVGLPEVFSSGASRDTLDRLAAGELNPGELLLPRAVLDVPVPTIAAMEGHAIGGGLALGLCADVVLIARESRYGCGFMNLGFTPGLGTTRLLENVVSRAVAHEMLYGGEPLKGGHFEGRSGFNYILPRSQVRPKALEVAQRIAEKPRVALVALKQVLATPKRVAFESSRAEEILMHRISFAQPDIAQLIGSQYGE